MIAAYHHLMMMLMLTIYNKPRAQGYLNRKLLVSAAAALQESTKHKQVTIFESNFTIRKEGDDKSILDDT